MAGQPLKPWQYRDFGSLVSLGGHSTVGNLMGGLAGRNLWLEGYFAWLMYVSLYQMHQRALHGLPKVALDTVARFLSRGTRPRVKLHLKVGTHLRSMFAFRPCANATAAIDTPGVHALLNHRRLELRAVPAPTSPAHQIHPVSVHLSA